MQKVIERISPGRAVRCVLIKSWLHAVCSGHLYIVPSERASFDDLAIVVRSKAQRLL